MTDNTTSLLEGTHYRLHKGRERLYELWEEWNEEYFGGELLRPEINLTEPSNPRRLADCGNRPIFVGDRRKSEIRIRPSLLVGTYPTLRRGSGNREGQFRVVTDVLMHEMIHQWQFEVSGQLDTNYKHHGPAFSAKANEIGAKLGVPLVRRTYRKDRGKDKDFADPQYWPHSVRPPEYYLWAYVPTSRDVRDKPEEDRLAKCEAAANSLARRFSVEEIQAITEMAVRMKGDA